jgi:phage tail-like protein
MNTDDKQAHGIYAWKLESDKLGVENLMFFQATLPSGSIDVGNVKMWGDSGQPQPIQGGGHQVTWQPVTLTRYLDDKSTSDTAPYKWFSDVMEKGATSETKSDVHLTCMNNDQPLYKWTLTGAVPTSYSHSEANAQTQGLMTETVTLTYETAKMEAG